MFEPVRFGKYLLIEKIATGGMAEVYKAKSYGVMGFEKLLVIKKILPHLSQNEEFVSLFVNEAKVSVSLNHANIIQVYDLGVVGTDYFIAMEYIHGPDLMQTIRMARRARQPIGAALGCFIVSEIARGLDYAHHLRDPAGQPLNVVHRDVSPHNVMLGYEGDVKLLDFGIAQVGRDLSENEGRPAGGKYGYMSPEHLGASPMDARSDVYSAGIVLFELATGKRLYAGMSVEEKKEAILKGTIPRPSSLAPMDSGLEEIIFTALARQPNLRFLSAMELHEALQDHLFHTGTKATRADLGVYLKQLFAEEYEKEAAAGSVINNFEPQFDPLANPDVGRPKAPLGLSLSGDGEDTDDVTGSLRHARRGGTGKSASRATGKSRTGTRKKRPRRKTPSPESTDAAGSDDSVSFSAVSAASLAAEGSERQRKRERLAEGERRDVYVLAADVLGIDRLSGQLEEAALLKFNYRFLRSLVTIVRRHKGTLDRFYNDRFLIFWGLKRTSERDLELCLDCARALADFGSTFRTGAKDTVHLCMGVHRGTLAAGATRDGGRLRRFVPLGDTLKLATRLCEIAERDQVLVSDRVASQAEGHRFEALEPRLIKGWDEPIPLHLLLPQPDDEAAPPPAGTWITRGDEISRVQTLLEQVEAGKSAGLSVVAEAGSGKTRYLLEVGRLAAERGFAFYMGKGRVHRAQEPLLPMADVVRHMAGLDSASDAAACREKLTALGVRHEMSTMEVHLLGTLLGLSFADSNLRYLAGDQRLAELFRALTRLLERRAAGKPMVLAIHNLHWVDRLTRELVRHLHRTLGPARVLFVVTGRPEDPYPFDESTGTEVRLPGWRKQEVEAFCMETLCADDVPHELVTFVLDASGGNALFVKELLRNMAREGLVSSSDGAVHIEGELRRSSVPDSVQTLIKSRLDALDRPLRLALEVASVVGKMFAFDEVTAVLGLLPEQAEETFEDLVATDLIRPRTGEGSAATYQFRNNLTWEVTYRSLISVRRRELHCRVGEAIEALYPDSRTPHLDILCAHFSEGGEMARAAIYAEEAGRLHAERNYNQEAIRRFQQAILLLRSAGDTTDERDVDRRLSAIYCRLSELSFNDGDHRAAKRHGNMALDYATDCDAVIQEAAALLVLCRVETALGHKGTVAAYLERLEDLGSQLADAALEADIRRELAEILVRQDATERAVRNLEIALEVTQDAKDARRQALILRALADVDLDRGAPAEAATRLGIACQVLKGTGDRALLGQIHHLRGRALIRDGDLPAALQAFQRAYRQRKKVDLTHSMVLDLDCIGEVHLRSGDRKKAGRYFKRSLTLAKDNGWTEGRALAEVHIGYLRQIKRASTDGAKILKQGLRHARQSDGHRVVAIGKALQAKIALKQGDPKHARRLDKEALAAATKADEKGLLDDLP